LEVLLLDIITAVSNQMTILPILSWPPITLQTLKVNWTVLITHSIFQNWVLFALLRLHRLKVWYSSILTLQLLIIFCFPLFFFLHHLLHRVAYQIMVLNIALPSCPILIIALTLYVLIRIVPDFIRTLLIRTTPHTVLNWSLVRLWSCFTIRIKRTLNTA
jgi:hypothetical protein